MIYLPVKIKPLAGHVSFETAYIVENYPYGSLRTQMKYWVETKDKHGQRVVTCSLNPKTNRWNKPHAGTYSQVICLFINEENGHVEHTHLGVWESYSDLNAFENAFDSVMTDWQRNSIKVLRSINLSQSPQSYWGLKDDEMAEYKAGIEEMSKTIPLPQKPSEFPKDSEAYNLAMVKWHDAVAARQNFRVKLVGNIKAKRENK
jgi:hypothetical protein